MRILPFTVNGQKLSKNGNFSNIIRGTKGYLKCKFDFEDGDWDWDRFNVIAIFETKDKEYGELLNADKTCMVPDEVTDFSSFKLALTGVSGDKRIITNKELIEQK